MADPRIDPRIYGGGIPQPLTTPAKPVQTPVDVPAASIGSPYLEQQATNSIRANNLDQASILASVGGAMTQWLPAHLYEAATAPVFVPTLEFKATESLQQVDFVMSSEQEKFLLNSRSQEEFQYKLNNMYSQNDAHAAMGDNPISTFITGALDPGYLAIDVASLGASRAARALGAGTGFARTAAGVSAFGLTYAAGKAEQTVHPITETEVFLNAMANGALTSALYRDGAVVARDARFPADTLAGVQRRMEPQLNPPTHPDYVGEVPVFGDNLTRPRVAATGAGETAVTYGGREARQGADYTGNQLLGRNAEKVVEVSNTADIANHSAAVRDGTTKIDPSAKAVYLPGDDRVYLVKENIKPGDDLQGIMLHEVGVHMNAERVLGTSSYGKLLDRIEELAATGNKRAKEAYASVPSNTPLHLVREEALGHYIERFHGKFGDGIIANIAQAGRDFLRKLGINVKLSESEIVQMVRKAAKGEAGSFDNAFPYVWHGSAVRGIDQLDTAFIGTGEGAQAFGWGHYLTSEKGTALDYRNKESIRRGINPEEGGLYRIKITAPEQSFLNLDSTAQSAVVADGLEALGIPSGLTGRQAYDELTKRLGSQAAASQALLDNGIRGNKFATGRTRGTAVTNSNYVVFSNADVDTAARYSLSTPASQQQAQTTVAQAVAKSVSWSLHKTLSAFSPKAAEIADMLVDNPLSMVGNSVASAARAIRADLQGVQYGYENLLAKAMADNGYGVGKRILTPRAAIAAQQGIEREVGLEMLRRNRLSMDGVPITHTNVDPRIKAMADSLDAVAKVSLAELKRAGVAGAEDIVEHSGYFSRRWDFSKFDEVEKALVAAGGTQATARGSIVDALSIGMQRANGWDSQLAQDIAGAIYDRTRRKGYFEDTVLRRHVGEDTLSELSDILAGSGIRGSRAQRVLDILAGKVDEAGKAPQLKHRVDIALDEAVVMPDGSQRALADLIDFNMANTTERYLDSVSAQSAFARKGLTKASDVVALRKEFLESIDSVGKRAEAADLFDNTVAALRGDPVGEKVPDFLRKAQAVTQMVGLARAGLFQFTEYATAMAHYGAVNTVMEMFKELPIARKLFSDPAEAEHLRNVLSRNASQDIRIRPFITRMEDNFEVPVSDAIQLAMTQAKQLTPYLNGLKYVQGHQARTVANLIVNTVERAAKGDAKAARALEEYGLESHILAKVSADINTHGMDTAKWSDATWDEVRGPVTKMMDDAVLRNRTGEIPAFAQFSSLGKFIFTFRSFVLGAHNKALAGTLNRNGFGGLGLLMAYQFPLTFAITAADNTLIKGKQESVEKTAGMAFGQMGSMGLFSEAIGVVLGNKQQFGSPGTIAIDRVYKLTGAVASGNGGQAGAAALNSIPLLSIILPVKALGEAMAQPPKKD